MKKILLIGTGGTLASKESKMGLIPEYSIEDILAYLPETKDLCKLEGVQILNLDSTNIQPKDWLMISECICTHYDEFDGFIVIHGTDTMAYTAAALSYLIQNSAKPIVVTGAQKPISDDETDARKNILQSIYYVLDERASDVNFVFHGEVIAGTRGRKEKSQSFDAFTSMDFPHKAVIRKNEVLTYIADSKDKELCCYHQMSGRVFDLKLVPGVHADVLQAIKDLYDAFIIEGFGVGGVPSLPEAGFVETVEELLDAGKVIVITTQVPLEGSDLSVYEVGRIFKQNKRLIEAYNMTLEATVAKLMWIMGQTGDPKTIAKMFYTQINHDLGS